MATTEIGELLIRIRADATKLEQALKNSGTQVKSFSDKVTSIGKNLTSAGMKLSLAVTAPLVLIGKKAMDAAMDVVESENLFEVSMGNMAKAARDWSEEFAKSVGLNEYNVRRNVGIFNVMFDSMGIGEQKAYDMAKGLTELSYDMASFYNMDVEEAFTKLQAGITGEIEPLKRLGIVINETTVATYAYANGIAEQGEKLTEQEKIVARYGLIMDQTSKAQGDLARTLDSPANKMRIFKEQIGLAMIALGQGLIPIVLKVVDIIKPFVEKFTNASDETKKFITVLLLIATATGPVLLILGQMVKAVSTLRNAFIGLNTAMHTAHGLLFLKFGGILGSIALALLQTGSSVQDMGDSFQRLDKLVFDATQTLNRANAGAFSESTGITKELAEENLSLLENIEKLAQEYPLLADKVLELNKKYQTGTMTYEEYNEELKLLIENKDILTVATDELASSEEGLTGIIKSNINSLIEQGYKQEAAIELAIEQAKAMGYTEDEINNVIEAEYNLSDETEEATESIQDQTDAVDELRSSFNKLIDAIFDGLDASNELQESEIALKKAKEELNKLVEEGKQGTEEYITKENELDDAYQNLISSNYKVYTSIWSTVEAKEAAKQKAFELAAEYVNLGKIGSEQFVLLAQQFGLTTDEIIQLADDMDIKLDEAARARFIEITADASNVYSTLNEVHKALGKLPKKVTTVIDIKYNQSIQGSMPENVKKLKKQSGGEVVQTGYIPDLNIIGIKGEGLLTKEIMNAIKTGRTDYMGVSGIARSGSSITNNITGNVFTVREEADINKITTQITQKIYDMQQIKKMGMG
jgi:uncharacterized protein YqgV (UPF0045/DUF77 family)